ncbi:MAG: protein kinase [Mogibacterium sp.]|nr:protein kinase [Mogibacterium sp.]
MSEEIRYKKYEPIFGSWYIKNRIGKGAVGQVYEIEREDLGKTYKAALKVISLPEGPDDIKRALSTGVQPGDLKDYYCDLVGKIATEFQYLAQLKGSSYIVNYEDHLIIEDEDEFRWDVLIKTELLTPLVEHAIEHPLEVNEVIELGIDICRALQFCGQYNIIHRDIKPENIFIGPSGTYKLGDFGIARVAEETQVNLSRKGTYTYMAPEVFHGEAYGQSADLYSLGIVMYKYLNHGRGPFMPPFPDKIQYDDAEKAFSERMSGRKLPAPALGFDKLNKIVLKACAYNPADRYSNASEMLSDLEELHLKRNKRIKNKRTRSAKSQQVKDPSISRRDTWIPDKEIKIQLHTDLEESRPADGALNETITYHNNAETGQSNHDSIVRREFFIFALVLVLILTLLATYISIPKEVTDITGLDPEVSMFYDATLNPEYVIEPKWFEDEPIAFLSTDEDVFTVNKDGALAAVSIGEADLIMHAKEYTETVHISVVPKVTDITGVEKTYKMITGDTMKLIPVLEPPEFANEKITYSSKDKSVATVSKSGEIKAVKAGNTNININAGGTSITTKISVEDPAPVVVYRNSSTNTKKKTTKTKSKKDSGGYFESGDDEYFGG